MVQSYSISVFDLILLTVEYKDFPKKIVLSRIVLHFK